MFSGRVLRWRAWGIVLGMFLLLPSAAAFSDIADSPYQEAINYARLQQLVNGYADNTFRPENLINRAEFTKILITAKLQENPTVTAANCFPDVNTADWFASYICYAKTNGFIDGYPDGTFRPDQNITVVEAAKILINVLDFPLSQTEGGEWYTSYLLRLEEKNSLLPSFTGLEHKLTRGEMAEMIWRLRENKNDLPAISAAELITPSCQRFTETALPNVDMERVRTAWLGWINAARAEAGLHPYVYNEQLSRTAFVWSDFSAARNNITHQRPGQTAYYDYWGILEWFRNLGLEFAAQHGVTFTENIGWWPYRCSAEDCTEKMIQTVRHTFDMFMGEKGKAYTAHYDSVMSPYYREIGFGVAVSPQDIAYNTTHYATAITSNPLPLCG